MLIKVPFTNTKGAYREGIAEGTVKAPDEILKAIEDVWSNENYKSIELEQRQIKEISSCEKIFDEAKEFLKKDEKVVFLGGDHSISYDLARAFKEFYKRSGLLVFDAHLDCMPPHKFPNHEEWLRALIEKKIFSTREIVHVGLRAACLEEINFAKERKLLFFSCKELFENFKKNVQKIVEKVRRFEKLYISIDIDAIDPVFAPGVAYIEPGGLTSREFLYLIQKLSVLKNLKAIDLVCVNPEKDFKGMTAKLAAKIVAELL
ncbi:MAG: arginase family protein [Candidatus Pacearchaeota archaeon]